MKIEILAKVIFRIDQKYDRIIGNHNLEDWESCPEEIKQIYFKNISAIKKNQKIKPEKLHQNAILILFNHGWKYGETFSEKNKTSPILLPFHQLSESQKISYQILYSITNSFLESEKQLCEHLHFCL